MSALSKSIQARKQHAKEKRDEYFSSGSRTPTPTSSMTAGMRNLSFVDPRANANAGFTGAKIKYSSANEKG